MNGKKAKQLRKLAAIKTGGAESVAYDQVDFHNKQCGFRTAHNGHRMPYFTVVSRRILTAGCTRQVYQSLK